MKVSKEGAKGEKVLTPEGMYTKCKILSVDPVEVHPDAASKGVEGRVLIEFETPDHKDRIVQPLNMYDVESPRSSSPHFNLLSAIWPKWQDRVDTDITDWVGHTVNFAVVHRTGPTGKPYAAFSYLPCK